MVFMDRTEPMIASRVLVAFVLGLMITGCAGLPGNVERTPSTALTNTADTRLGKDVRRAVAPTRASPASIRFPMPRTPSPRASSSPGSPIEASTCSTTSGTATRPAN